MGRREALFNYDFETDEVMPTYTLGVHIRNIRNDYLRKTFTASLKKAQELEYSKNPGKAEVSKFLDNTDNFIIPERFFNMVRTAIRKVFLKARSTLETKHDISFLTWDIKEAFFYRNPQDATEWILGVIYKGDYED